MLRFVEGGVFGRRGLGRGGAGQTADGHGGVLGRDVEVAVDGRGDPSVGNRELLNLFHRFERERRWGSEMLRRARGGRG